MRIGSTPPVKRNVGIADADAIAACLKTHGGRATTSQISADTRLPTTTVERVLGSNPKRFTPHGNGWQIKP